MLLVKSFHLDHVFHIGSTLNFTRHRNFPVIAEHPFDIGDEIVKDLVEQITDSLGILRLDVNYDTVVDSGYELTWYS